MISVLIKLGIFFVSFAATMIIGLVMAAKKLNKREEKKNKEVQNDLSKDSGCN